MVEHIVLAVQVGSYLVLGGLFYAAGDWRLGTAQLLLAGVQTVIFA